MNDQEQINDFVEQWQMMDAITSVVNGNGLSVWNLCYNETSFTLELTSHLTEEGITDLCGQFPLSASYCGEGEQGSIFELQ